MQKAKGRLIAALVGVALGTGLLATRVDARDATPPSGYQVERDTGTIYDGTWALVECGTPIHHWEGPGCFCGYPDKNCLPCETPCSGGHRNSIGYTPFLPGFIMSIFGKEGPNGTRYIPLPYPKQTNKDK